MGGKWAGVWKVRCGLVPVSVRKGKVEMGGDGQGREGKEGGKRERK